MIDLDFDALLSYLLGLAGGRVEILLFTGVPWTLTAVVNGTLISRQAIGHALESGDDSLTLMIEADAEFQTITLDRDRFESASLDDFGIKSRFKGVEFEIRPL